MEFAIWYHDSIYNPLQADNEAASVRYFREQVGGCGNREWAEDVARLILATDPKRPRSGREDENLIIDIDLSILGASSDEYSVYQRAVRAEYSEVSDTDFAKGRRAILERFLEGPIYVTGYFSQLEDQARENLTEELSSLESAMQ